MIKKYFKYILLTFTVMFLFQLDTFAKTEKVALNKTTTINKSCYYQYETLAGTVYQTTENKILVTSETQHHISSSGVSHGGGGNSSNNTKVNFATSDTTQDSDFYINGNFTCVPMYVYIYEDEITGTTIDIQPKKKNDFVLNNGWVLKETISGKEKEYISACVYEAEGSKFIANFNPITKKINTSFENAGGTIKSNAKKNWNYNDSGLICRDDIVLDICGSVVGLEAMTNMNVRTTSDKMQKSCYKSTSPAPDGVTVTEKDTKYSGSKLLFLSDICEEDATTMKVVRFIGYLLVIVKILIPIGLIIVGVINFSKAMLSGNDDSIKKNAYSFAWKIVFAIVIFVLPTVINFIVGLIDGATDGTEDYENCRNCIFDPKNCDIPNE